MSNFITYDWSRIEAAMRSGDTTAQDEVAHLNHLFSELRKTRNREERESVAAAKLKEKRDADPNTPVYYKGHDSRFFSKNVEWMLKSGDGRRRMVVQVKFKGKKEAQEWNMPYDHISLDWREQKLDVRGILDGFAGLVHHPNERPW